MAVDEFGREIPAGRGRRSPSPSYRGGGGDGPSHLFGELPTSRYASREGRKRKHRSESPQPRRKGHHHHHHHQPHPSKLYADELMLCQYLWKDQNPDKSEEDYNEYRKSYGLNYVRTFFNEHMDDSWFRSLYSPLGKYRVALQERNRAVDEARAIQKELEESLEKKSGEAPFFVLKARLGGGTKSGENAVPTTHAIGIASEVLPVQEVPPHVTDEQLTVALMAHASPETKEDVTLYSGTPSPSDLTRACYLKCSSQVRKDIIQNLNHLGRGDAAANPTDGGAHVPRKEDTYLPKTLELKVECSDAYGRVELDADGKGGAPEDNTGIPNRSAVVWVSTQPVASPVKVLSVAVSSKERIAQDQKLALDLAKAYDAHRNIPPNCRLETLVEKVFPSLEQAQDVEDALDVTIAYLRRVHLFSFYNGCVASDHVADVFAGSHASSTIHLRLANADEILQANKQDTPEATIEGEGDKEPAAKDLLVQRLDDAVQKSLDKVKEWILGDANYLVCKTIDQDAQNIEHQEKELQETWIQDHALVDADGRARCAFHFCRKLFKDSAFLKKHLMKKHCDFLKAEQAKCHDPFMMTLWDQQEQRPVPPILVDCGRAFKNVPSPVLGASNPMAADPEPELWRRQEERRKLEQEEQEARRERSQQHRDDGPAPSLDGPLSEPRSHSHTPRQNFVDVDDMKVEKVEMAFDKVEIPVQPPKKKKKKKLL